MVDGMGSVGAELGRALGGSVNEGVGVCLDQCSGLCIFQRLSCATKTVWKSEGKRWRNECIRMVAEGKLFSSQILNNDGVSPGLTELHTQSGMCMRKTEAFET